MCPSHCSPRFAASLGFAAALSFLRVGADTCTAPPSGWVAWWPAEGNGEERRSFTPATADGSTFGAGRVGQGFGFAGATAGLSLGAAPWLQREDFTVEAWVQRRDATVAANGAGDRGWILSFGAGGWGVGVLDDGRLVLSRVGEADVASASPVVTDTAFHHVAFTRSEGTVTFYADGTAVGEAELDQRFRFETPAAIGRRGDDKSGSFAGTIDELAVFDRALSAAEVAALFGAGSAGKCIPAADVPNDVAAGTERWIRGGAATGNQVVVSDGFSVFGRLRLESTEGGYVSGVDVGDGFLANEAGGEVAVNVGSGGPRYLRGNFLNRGTMNVRQGLTVDRSLAILRNEGTIDLSTGGLLLRGAGVQLELAGGAVTGAQSIDAVSAQIRFLDGRLEVPVTAVNSTVEFGPGNTNAAAIVLAGSGSRLRGDIAPAQSVTVEGSARVGNTVARAPLGFANAGTLRLQSRDGGYQASLALDSGRLTNRTGGLLVSGVGAGGPRTLTAALVNEGTFRTDQPLTLVWPGGVHANRGTVGISAGQTLYLSGNGQTFRQEAGTLRIDGYLDATGIRFEYLGGRIEGPLELHQGTLVLSSAATEPASFVLAGSSSKFEGDIQPGQSVWIRGDSWDSHTTVTVGAFANRGTVLLRSRDGGYRSSLTVTGGSLSNEVGGQLIVAPGAGGPRELQAELANRGAFLVQQPVSLNAAGANHLNRGTIDIAPGQTLGIAGQGQTLRQEAGTINIGGGMDLSSLNL
ncbi:MAG: LamG domain-containing protein [Verrucomicrobia bacterium]|nr:MAG: LamG domain-containing protein [Verrucomicrobiota bacterium]